MGQVTALQLYSLIRFSGTLLTGIVLANSWWTTSEIAIYEALLFLGNLVSFFWIGGGQNAYLAYFPKLDVARQQRLRFTIFCLFLGLSVLFGGLLYFAQDWILERFTNFEALPHMDLLAIFLILNVPTYLVQLFYLFERKYQSIVGYALLAYGGQFLVVAVPVLLGYSMGLIFQCLVALALLKFLWTLRLLWQYAQFRLDPILLKGLVVLGIPLMLHLLIGNSVEYIDGLIVTSYFEAEETFALFRYGARELPLTVLLIGALVKALIPEIANATEVGLTAVKTATWQLMRWLFPLSMAFMLASPYLFRWVYGPEFIVSAMVFNLFLVLLTSRILLPQVVIIGLQKNYFLVLSAIVETIVNVGLSLWWVRFWGLEGIALATIVAFAVNKLNMILFLYFRFGIRPGAYIPMRGYLLLSTLLILVYLIFRVWLI
ncbi:MAG: polysaccharide biosynthesis C-terminal domain-containing protein [Phaeodactylibacter sp.]|nr:polysaccharide biosynthesis C-terminal domain-containing protein [Phaeodactylibacter sp.]